MYRDRVGFYQASLPILERIRVSLFWEGIGTSLWKAQKTHSIQYSLEVLDGSVDDFRDYIGSMSQFISWDEVAGFLDTDGTIKLRCRRRTPELDLVWSQCEANKANLDALALFLETHGLRFSLRPFLSCGYPQWSLRPAKPAAHAVLLSTLPHLQLKVGKAEAALAVL